MAKQQVKHTNKTLLSNFWSQPFYIKLSRQFSNDTKNDFWMNDLIQRAKNHKRILDIGSGDGTRLNLLRVKSDLYGIDISKEAVTAGRKKYPKIKLYQGNGAKMPFPKSFFDLTYTAFCLEHFTNPQKVISEMIRVTNTNGTLVFVAPNYGSPLILSPGVKIPRLYKVINLLKHELINSFPLSQKNNLGWMKIPPQLNKDFQADDDAVNLPYAHTLVRFLKRNGIKIEYVSSGWEASRSGLKEAILSVMKRSKLFDIYPLKYWGPTLFLIATKIELTSGKHKSKHPGKIFLKKESETGL